VGLIPLPKTLFELDKPNSFVFVEGVAVNNKQDVAGSPHGIQLCVQLLFHHSLGPDQ
jgi:hypothetical protein